MTELDDQKMGNRTRNKKRLIMVALMMLFLAPVVAGWLWKPDSFRNRGNLIEPPVALSNVSMETVARGVIDLNEILGLHFKIFLAFLKSAFNIILSLGLNNLLSILIYFL